MSHARNMLSRLPQLYRDGELVEAILAQPGTQLEILDEEAIEVQRAHWFNTALSLEEAARLAALLDLAPEPWHTLKEFRAWVHSFRDAMVERGTVTKPALQTFITEFVSRAIPGAMLPITEESWTSAPFPGRPAFVENPRRRRVESAPGAGGLQPLHQFTITQRGLDETRAAFLLTGLPGAPECVPVIANLSTGQALIFLGNIRPGERLWLRPTPEGFMEARLEDRDVTERLRSLSNLTPGQPWAPADVEKPARAFRLPRGANDLWFLPVAHFNEPGLDRFLFALADLLLQQGSFDESRFDHALFRQEPAVLLRVTWIETEPASFEIQLPGESLGHAPAQLNTAEEQRERVRFSLEASVRRLKAAGVRSAVPLRAHTETQGQMDRLAAVLPLVVREIAPTGVDALPEAGGLFSVTEFENSTFR